MLRSCSDSIALIAIKKPPVISPVSTKCSTLDK